MTKKIAVVLVALVLTSTGCAHLKYQVYVYNGTSAKITKARVTLASGDGLSFGTLDPNVDAGMWPVKGTMGKECTVEWTDAGQARKSAKALVTRKFRDDSIIFLINSNDTVTVETGRGLYGHRNKK